MKYKKSIKTVLDKTSLHLCQSSATYKEWKNKENESPESDNSKGRAVQRQCIFSIRIFSTVLINVYRH